MPTSTSTTAAMTAAGMCERRLHPRTQQQQARREGSPGVGDFHLSSVGRRH
jgi:hypothetical protein